MLPAGVANAYKSTFGRYAQDGGIYTRRGDPIYDDMTAGELFAQTFGFPPTEYTFRQERNASSKGIDIAVNKERSRLTKQYYIARRMGDFNRMMELTEEMNAFGRTHPEARIDRESLINSMKRHAETTKEMGKYNGVTISSLYRKTIDDLRRDWGD
jgi:hypothetical protein